MGSVKYHAVRESCQTTDHAGSEALMCGETTILPGSKPIICRHYRSLVFSIVEANLIQAVCA